MAAPQYAPPRQTRPAEPIYEYVEEPTPDQTTIGYEPTPYDGSIPFPGKDAEFLRWLLNFKKQVTIPLRNLWRGYEQNDDGTWKKPTNPSRVMNERGITWSISFIESYINPVYIASNYDERAMNWTMREAGRVVWNNLSCRYEEFGLNKLDIHRVASEIISKLHAILLGALNNGFRNFFKSTHSTVESLVTEPPGKRGILGGFRNMTHAGDKNREVQGNW